MSRSSRAATIPPSQQPSASRWVFPAILVLATGLVYGQIVRHDFVFWDDDAHILYNPYFHPVSWENTLRFWQGPYFNHYVPLSYTVFAVEAWLARRPPAADGEPKFNAAVFHATSLALHIACVWLVYRLLRRLTAHGPAALVGALLFALHPLQVESVAWISETRGLLAALFTLIGLYAWYCFVDTPAQVAATLRWAWYALAMLAFVAALLSKPSAVAAPLLAAIVSWHRATWRQLVFGLLPTLVFAAALTVLTRQAQTAEGMYFVPPVWARPLIAAEALQFYLAKLCIPWPLVPHYDHAARDVMQRWWFPWCWIGPVLLAVLLVRRPQRDWLTAAGLLIAALLPVLGLMPFAYQDTSTVADRYMYLALLGPAWLVAATLARVHRRVAWYTAAALLLACASLAFVQASRWKNTETLFSYTLAINPRSQIAHNNYATWLTRQGRYDEALSHADEALQLNAQSAVAFGIRAAALDALGRHDEGLDAYRDAVKHDGASVTAHLALAGALARSGDAPAAEAEYREALRLEPDSMQAAFNLAELLEKEQRDAEAIPLFEKVLSRHPDDFRARLMLGTLFARDGRYSAAADHFRQLVEVTGDLQSRAQLAEALVAQGEMTEALAQYKELLREPSPLWPQMAGRAAWLLATHPDGAVRDSRQAQQLALAACRQTAWQQPELLRALAAAHAESGDFSQALTVARQAEEVARSRRDSQALSQIESDLRSYAGSRPLRGQPRHPTNWGRASDRVSNPAP